MKLWQGRQSGEGTPQLEALNNSIGFDQRLWREDIRGSVAHARMLGRQRILTEAEALALTDGLLAIERDIDAGRLTIDPRAEDIHTFMEQELTRRLGDLGKKLHTGRSRNDQVALDLRLHLRNAIDALSVQAQALQSALEAQAEAHRQSAMPGYTHLQRAQPVTLARHLMAYHAMLARDCGRLADCRKRLNVSPLGAGALAGSSFPLDRAFVAQELGFDGVIDNTLDAVSDRDFVIELAAALSILMMHLSRLCEELVLWSSQEFGFIAMADAYATGSSMMPQKKNPDAAELVRGKTGRVYGALMTLLTVMKALPLAYNKDMQEDKEAIFDALDTAFLSLAAVRGMIETMTPRVERMREALADGFVMATALADYLTRKGLPFRDAYAITGRIVRHCAETGERFETLTLAAYQQFCPQIDADVYESVRLDASALTG
ncbi:MAG: argininosuccinate lyase [Vampirovibrionales bacterium]|nr:argininosuccinate lyase [Vampirovibrionales bacterium]